MPELFEAGLQDLAEHARRTGRHDPAAVVRARAARRRKRRHAATAALGVFLAAALGTGIAVARPTPNPGPPAASPSPSPSASPSAPRSTSASPSTSGNAPPTGVLSGSRQIYFFVLDQGEEVPEAVLAVTSSDRVQVTADYGERALFVATPAPSGHGEYLIKTGKLRSGGAALCLSIRSNGAKPLTVVTAACDPADDNQRFTFHENGKDNQDRMTYAIDNQSAYLQWFPNGTSGLIAEETGDAALNTTFVLIDRGPSTVPE